MGLMEEASNVKMPEDVYLVVIDDSRDGKRSKLYLKRQAALQKFQWLVQDYEWRHRVTVRFAASERRTEIFVATPCGFDPFDGSLQWLQIEHHLLETPGEKDE